MMIYNVRQSASVVVSILLLLTDQLEHGVMSIQEGSLDLHDLCQLQSDILYMFVTLD